MYRRTALLIISMACVVCTINSANAVTWTAGDLVRAMRQAQANGQPFDRLLAEKVSELLAESGLKIVDDRLVYSDKLPPTSENLAEDQQAEDYIKEQQKKKLWEALKAVAGTLGLVGPGWGSCLTAPIPAGSPIAVNSTGIIVNAKFSNSGTYIDLRTQPNQVALTLNVNADLYAETKVGLEWCGFVAWPYSCGVSLVKNPLCPPPYPVPSTCYKKVLGVKVPYPCTKWVTPPCSLPDVCPLPIPDAKIVEERWTDRALATAIGKLKGTVTLTLDHVLTVGSNSITIGAVPPTLSGMVQDLPGAVLGAVAPDTRLISVPVPPFVIPHAATSPVLQTIGTLANGLAPLMHLTGYSEELLIREKVTKRLIKQQQERLNAEYSQYFPLTLQLPNFDNLDPASQALLKLVLDYLYANIDVIGEFALDVVRNNWTEVLYYVLTDNRAGLAQLFGYQALCPSIQNLKANMPSGPLYSAASGTCTAVDARNPGNGPFYATPSCTTAIGFQPENLTNYCRESLTAKPNPYLGNAAAWPISNIEVDTLPPIPNGPSLPNVSSKWSTSTSTQLAVGVEPINNNHIPFMKRINFRQVDGCELEMRVYKKDIAATNLTPLVWVHGGSWTYRSSGFLGMESLVSSYTEDNFVVFAPFYRLTGDKDGNTECRNVTWERVAADVEAAFDWVKANGASFGADTSGKIAVTGQSSGAFLAAWLMTHRADEVSGGLLVYPPTDLNDFLTRLQGFDGASFPPLSDGANTPYDPSQGQEVIETYLGLPKGGALTVNLNSPPAYLPANSLAKIVADGISVIPPLTYPPAFILHGTRDSLLTYSQSQVLCEAYGGVVNVDWLTTTDLRAVFACGGDRGQLHLFKEAGHVFEVCPFTNIAGACRAGSPASASLLTDSIQKGRRWLLNREFAPLPVVNVSASANDAGNPPSEHLR